MAITRPPAELARSERGAAIVAKHEADNRRDRVAAMALHSKSLRGSRSAASAVKPATAPAVAHSVPNAAATKVHAPSSAVKPPAVAPMDVAASPAPAVHPAKPAVTADSLVALARSVGLTGFAAQTR